MNDQIVKVFGFVVVLFAALVFFTSRATVFDAHALNANPLNSRAAIAAEKIKRGEILAADGTVLAKSVAAPGGTWTRTYPTGSLFAQTVGYWTNEKGNAAGLEVTRSTQLDGQRSGLTSIFGPLNGNRQVGNDVYTTLDTKAQQVARAALAGRIGSVVALDPRTGAVLAMYSNPSYDPNHPNAACANQCQFDRATQSAYPPGSTFKIVTAAPAINTGKFTPNSILDGNSPRLISGVPLHNDANASYGPVTLTKALTDSINTVWSQVGVDLGIPTMTEYMRRYGFYAKPPIDLPPGELRASDVLTPSGGAYRPGSPSEDIGRIAIGQGGLAVTPLQMAMVASAVANDGRLMVPHLTARIVNPGGQAIQTIAPRLYHRVMSARAAQEINLMMRTVVDEGTGTPARLASGITFAGKTGTASVGPAGSNETQPWFIGFAPANAPKVAIAVDVERTAGGYGGQVAGPIAGQVVQTLLAEGR